MEEMISSRTTTTMVITNDLIALAASDRAPGPCCACRGTGAGRCVPQAGASAQSESLVRKWPHTTVVERGSPLRPGLSSITFGTVHAHLSSMFSGAYSRCGVSWPHFSQYQNLVVLMFSSLERQVRLLRHAPQAPLAFCPGCGCMTSATVTMSTALKVTAVVLATISNLGMLALHRFLL
jgi:hypothetical protein